MLPRLSGIDVCRQLRKRSAVPIIMVTAKGAEIDTVVGLEVGADDYITKPYRMREVVARMRAVLRRSPADSVGAPDLSPGSLAVGDVVLDPDEHRVTIDGGDVALPLKEFELLHLLLANAGRVLPQGDADRPGVGQRLRRRHQDARRAHQAAARQGRTRIRPARSGSSPTAASATSSPRTSRHSEGLAGRRRGSTMPPCQPAGAPCLQPRPGA